MAPKRSSAKPRARKPRDEDAAPRAAPGEAPTPRASSDDAEPSDADLEQLEPAEAELVEDPADAGGRAAPRGRALVPFKDARGRDALQQYMNEVGRHPLLSRNEELELARRFHDDGDVSAARKLVVSNLRLVVKLAFEYHRNTFNVLDLIQEGNVGLLHAVQKFDPYKNVKLSTYAAWWIRAYILRYVMENWRVVKLGTTQAQRKLFFNLKKERDRLLRQGVDPEPKLLAQRLDVTEQDVTDMQQRMSGDELSIDTPLGDDSKQTQGDRLSEQGRGADDKLGDQELLARFQTELAAFAKTLTDEKERYIFEKRLTAEEPLKLQEIGTHFGVSRERARQVEAKLIARLKAHVQQALPDFKELSFERDD